MHRRVGNATLSQPAFPRGKQCEFPMGEIPMGQFSCKINKSKIKHTNTVYSGSGGGGGGGGGVREKGWL